MPSPLEEPLAIVFSLSHPECIPSLFLLPFLWVIWIKWFFAFLVFSSPFYTIIMLSECGELFHKGNKTSIYPGWSEKPSKNPLVWTLSNKFLSLNNNNKKKTWHSTPALNHWIARAHPFEMKRIWFRVNFLHVFTTTWEEGKVQIMYL